MFRMSIQELIRQSSCRQAVLEGNVAVRQVLEFPGARHIWGLKCQQHVLTQVGTPYYMSPETCSMGLHSYASDVWAMGCVFPATAWNKFSYTLAVTGCTFFVAMGVVGSCHGRFSTSCQL